MAEQRSSGLAAWNTGFGPQPEGTRGIDQFIGEGDMIERGHGSAFIRQFVDEQFRSGLPRMVTDPDFLNARALRACEKADFVRDRMHGRDAGWAGAADGG